MLHYLQIVNKYEFHGSTRYNRCELTNNSLTYLLLLLNAEFFADRNVVNKYEFHSLWFDPTVARNHDLSGTTAASSLTIPSPNNKYENLNRFCFTAITNACFILGTNAGVRIQPNQTSNGGRMVLHHGQQIHIGSYDISNMHDNRPIDQQHQMTGQYQSACPPPSYENAINTSESAGECEQV